MHACVRVCLGRLLVINYKRTYQVKVYRLVVNISHNIVWAKMEPKTIFGLLFFGIIKKTRTLFSS